MQDLAEDLANHFKPRAGAGIVRRMWKQRQKKIGNGLFDRGFGARNRNERSVRRARGTLQSIGRAA